ncbi:MAG TPA: DUF2946 family protein [Paraburkholderia sp.]|nr:DUF2946 family protein [Paraburkholderia sp.]
MFVPVVSQLIVSAQRAEPAASFCSAVHDTADQTGHQRTPLSACGYCDLLATHVAMPAIPPAPVHVLLLPGMAVATALSTAFRPLGAFPSGRPRDPPYHA